MPAHRDRGEPPAVSAPSQVMKQNGRVRPAAVAGRFYPGNPAELRSTVEQLLASARTEQRPAPKALIAPHAGYVYSGPIAASAYVTLESARTLIRRVVLIGPSHFVRFDGVAGSSASAFATPLGDVPVDAQALGAISPLCRFSTCDPAHAREHALEVQLPFLQVVLDDFTTVPLVVGDATPGEVAEVLEALWGGPETLVVVSSDLSHYYDSSAARRLDASTAKAIEHLAPDQIAEEGACGRLPICGLLQTARKHSLRVRTLDLRNSGDTSGPRHQVVGYGAFGFYETPSRDIPR